MRASAARHLPRLLPVRRVRLSSLTKRISPLTFQLRSKCSQSVLASQYSNENGLGKTPSVLSSKFWGRKLVWSRAAVNTLRCLVGCTLGDFSSMWYLQAFYPDLGTGTIMGISMASGVMTSVLLETSLLRFGRDRLSWIVAGKTATGMSLISMVSMELAENLVDYHLTGGIIDLHSPQFWGAAFVSVSVGFLTPLPYNYLRLRKYGKACH